MLPRCLFLEAGYSFRQILSQTLSKKIAPTNVEFSTGKAVGGGSLPPFCRLGHHRGHDRATAETASQIGLSHSKSLFCRPLPTKRLIPIPGHTSPRQVTTSKQVLCGWQSLLRRTGIPANRFDQIRFYTIANRVALAGALLGNRLALLGGSQQPFYAASRRPG